MGGVSTLGPLQRPNIPTPRYPDISNTLEPGLQVKRVSEKRVSESVVSIYSLLTTGQREYPDASTYGQGATDHASAFAARAAGGGVPPYK